VEPVRNFEQIRGLRGISDAHGFQFRTPIRIVDASAQQHAVVGQTESPGMSVDVGIVLGAIKPGDPLGTDLLEIRIIGLQQPDQVGIRWLVYVNPLSGMTMISRASSTSTSA